MYFGKLQSSDGSIKHMGDQRTGAAAGDDEQEYDGDDFEDDNASAEDEQEEGLDVKGTG